MLSIKLGRPVTKKNRIVQKLLLVHFNKTIIILLITYLHLILGLSFNANDSIFAELVIVGWL